MLDSTIWGKPAKEMIIIRLWRIVNALCRCYLEHIFVISGSYGMFYWTLSTKAPLIN